MALNPNIALIPGRQESPLMALGRGIQSGQQMAATKQQMDLQRQQEDLQQQQAQAQQAAVQRQMTQEDAEALRQGLAAVFTKMRALPEDQREAYKLQAANEIKNLYGVAIPQEEVVAFPTDNASLDANIAGLTGGSTQKMTEYQKASLEQRKQALDKPTANERDLATYRKLKEESPEEAEMFGRQVGLLPDTEELTSTGEKALIAAQDSYFQGTKDAREYDLLAQDFERAKDSLPAGKSFTFQEFLKNVAGSQDEATELRRRFNAVRLSEALVNLPPGPATDRDVIEAFKGVPREDASPEQIVSFLKGSAKLKAIDNEFNLFKADYISKNNNTKGLLKAWQEKMDSGDVEAVNALKGGDNQSKQSDLSNLSDDDLLDF